MATFNMQNQTVTYQYAADVINLDKVTNQTEFAQQIKNLSAEIARARSLNAIDPIQAEQAQNALIEASEEAQKAEPTKSRITLSLQTAQTIVRGAVGAGGLYMAFEKALQVAHQLF